MGLPLYLVVTVAVSAALTRFLRQSSATAEWRATVTARSAFFGKLLSCPHCASFWFALLCSLFLASTLIEFGAIIIIGWRGSFYANRMLDKLAAPAVAPTEAEQRCHVCDAEYTEEFLERQDIKFCSHGCWFDYLRARPKSHDRLFDKTGAVIKQEIYPMSYENIDPPRANELLNGEEGYT